jgi:UDP-N-acetylglucosamine--N-acetylmuramyl-(pentapeptide) pyrophosphoryl-undecaprenol N-acetylglucosamine transferase
MSEEKRTNPPLGVVFAGGGTGGHLFPAIAIAEEFQDRNPESRILFISSGRPIEEKVLSKTGFEKLIIHVEGIKGKRMWVKLKSLIILPKGLFSAMGLLMRFKPDVVIGMGGYSAGPVILSAWMLRISRVICEQNKLSGVTNRLLSYFADRIYVSYEDTSLTSSAEKIRLTGNPVRKEIVKKLRPHEKSLTGSQQFTVLVLGGSQGAHGLNRAVIDALQFLKNPGKYFFVHQSGALDEDMVKKAYRENNIAHMAAAFFDDMACLYRSADLVICRSGATTVAEVTIAGSAVIFVPFPHAADNHQVFNAKPLVDAGAAEMILEHQISPKSLSEKIEYYASHPEALAKMKDKIGRFGKPDAAQRIVEDIYQLLAKRMERMQCAA